MEGFGGFPLCCIDVIFELMLFLNFCVFAVFVCFALSPGTRVGSGFLTQSLYYANDCSVS